MGNTPFLPHHHCDSLKTFFNLLIGANGKEHQ